MGQWCLEESGQAPIPPPRAQLHRLKELGAREAILHLQKHTLSLPLSFRPYPLPQVTAERASMQKWGMGLALPGTWEQVTSPPEHCWQAYSSRPVQRWPNAAPACNPGEAVCTWCPGLGTSRSPQGDFIRICWRLVPGVAGRGVTADLACSDTG